MPPTSSFQHALQQATAAHRAGDVRRALDQYQALLKSQPRDANLLQLAGLAAHQLGEHRRAVQLISRAIEQRPDVAPLYTNLGEAQRALGALDEAVAAYRRGLELRPGHAPTLCNLGQALEATERWDEAATCYRDAIQQDPQFRPAWHDYAASLLQLGQTDTARTVLQQALARWPAEPELQLLLAESCSRLGLADEAAAAAGIATGQDISPPSRQRAARILLDLGLESEAEVQFRRAIQQDPQLAAAHHGLAALHLVRGDRRAAGQSARRALAIDPTLGAAHLLLAGLKRHDEPDAAAIQAATEVLEAGTASRTDRLACHFALGKMHDDCGQYRAAFEHFAAGNRLLREGRPPPREPPEQLYPRIAEVYNRELLVQRSGWGAQTQTPVFIIGMPRSGTTLVEQIIASHPQAGGRGELRLVGWLLAAWARGRGGDDPLRVLTAMTEADLQRMARAYEQHLTTDAEPGWQRICDKMPSNYRHVGLIHLMFPQARIVHCRRDPRDTCLSNYFTWFAEGNAESTDLTAIGRHYRAYEGLMQHWHTVLPGRIFDLSYEQLVADPEPVVASLLAHLGLPWDQRCLRFHETSRSVVTASASQVREPFNRRSIGRWRHYEPWLDPLIAALEQ